MFKKLLFTTIAILSFAVGTLNAQCENNTLEITFESDIFGSEISFAIYDLSIGDSIYYGDGFSSNTSYFSSLCVEDGCYLLEAYDSFGDGWNGGVISFSVDGVFIGSYTLLSDSFGVYLFSVNSEDCPLGGCDDPNACNYDSTSEFSDGSCTFPGCMDSTANNYNPFAGCDDADSCTYPCEEGYITGQMYVCTWNDAANVGLTITGDDGSVVFDQQGFPNVTIDYFDICLEEGVCYTAVMTNSEETGWYAGYFWVNVDGVQIINDFLDDDLSYEEAEFSVDGTCGEIYGCMDESACNFDSNATSNGSNCTYPGCMDSTADNYNPWAGCGDDTLCTYPIECEEGQTAVTLYVCTFSNKENVNLQIVDDAGNVIFEQYGFSSAIEYYDLCLDAETCYTANMSNDVDPGWYGGYFWVNGGGIEYVNESLDVDLNAESVDFSIDGTCGPVYGCNDADACNYDSTATSNDGSCTYPGCTDSLALNFDPFAGCDDDSCEYLEDCEANVVVGLLEIGSFGTEMSWNLINDSGIAIATGVGVVSGVSVTTFCAEDGCYTLEMVDSWGDGWNGGQITFVIDGDEYGPYTLDSGELGFASFGINTEGCDDLEGCTDAAACNYNASATADDGSCTYPGCNDSTALNYNPSAGCNDGSCIYEIEECDDTWVTVFLATDQFGNEISWDITNDTGDVIAGGDTYGNNEAMIVDTLCLPDGCYIVNMYDTFGDGWTFGGTTGYISINVEGDTTTTGTLLEGNYGNFGFGVNTEDCEGSGELEGCTDPLAINYNPIASVDDGSCEYFSGDCEALFGIFDIIEEEDLVIIVNLSTGTDLTYLWDFGDGTTSTDEFPIHFYDEDGTYDVCLSITSSVDSTIVCEDTYCVAVTYDGANLVIEEEDGSTNTVEGGFAINIMSEEDAESYIGINEFVLTPSDINLYPNPTQNELNVNLSEMARGANSIDIFDISGRLIISESNTLTSSRSTIDVNGLSNGIYVLKFSNENGTVTKRFEVSK